MARTPRCDVLAISSPGGHWVELTRLFPAFDGLAVEYATTDAGRSDRRTGRPPPRPDGCQQADAMATAGLQLAGLSARLEFASASHRISTGAAPGLIAIVCGKLIGARAVWLDIFGLVDRMTLSGRMVKPFADLYLVQWPHLAKPDGPHFRGSLL